LKRTESNKGFRYSIRCENEYPFVSVIVPFFGTSTVVLDRCIQALLAQKYPGDKLEVIIVDNNVDPLLFDRYRSGIVSLRVIHEPQPGSYCARNRGISVARGEVCAFTDSDCVPAGDWIESGVRLLQSTPNCGLVAGSVILRFRNLNVPGLFETYDLCMNLRQEEYVRKFHFGATANLMAYSAVFDKVGRFNETFLSGGDCEWGLMVWKMGYQQVFARDAVVYHPARSTLAAVCEKARRLAGQDFMRMRGHKGCWIHFLLLEILRAARHMRIAWKRRREFGILRALQVMAVIGHVQTTKYLELVRLLRGGAPRR
jgi:glycosyltransferase involved in cell wall biosynthesis